MTNAFSLQPLRHLAQQRNDAATKKLGLLNRNRQSAQDKLEMLQQYRNDYREKMLDAQKNGLELSDLKNFQDFIYRLDDAIKQQNDTVAKTQASVQLGISELSETQRRMKSFDTLAQRHAESEKKLEAKLEQRLQDEHSGRRAFYKNTEFDEDN